MKQNYEFKNEKKNNKLISDCHQFSGNAHWDGCGCNDCLPTMQIQQVAGH